MDSMLYEEAVRLFDQALAKEPARPGLRTRQAYAYYRMNLSGKAVEVLNNELELFPNDLKALALLSFVQYRSGHPEEAEHTAGRFRDVLEQALKKQGREAIGIMPRDSEKWVRETRKKIDAILKPLFPNAGVPAYILALQAIKRHDAKTARSMLIEAQAMSYFPTDCWIQAVRAEMDQKNWAEALRLCQNSGDIGFTDITTLSLDRSRMPGLLLEDKKKIQLTAIAEIHLMMGMIYEESGRPAEAMECLQRAAAQKPFDADILRNLAIARINRNEIDEAGPLLQKAVNLNPLDFQSQMLLEQAQNKRRRPDGAAKVALSMDRSTDLDVRYRYVFETDPEKIANSANVNAMQLIQEGLISEAIRWLRSFIEIYENSPTIYYNLGQLYNTQGLEHEALRFGLRAIELKRDYRDAYDLVGNVCFKMMDLESSISFYEQAVRLDPKDPVGYYNLGCALSEAGDPVNAEKNWLEAVRLENAPLSARDALREDLDALKIAVTVKVESISSPACQFLAFLYADQGRKELALSYFKKALEYNPKNLVPYLEIGKLYLEQAESGKAEEYFNKYLSMGGDEAKVKALVKKEA